MTQRRAKLQTAGSAGRAKSAERVERAAPAERAGRAERTDGLANAGVRAAAPGFFERVWALVAAIPPGKVMTYGQIAACLDNVCSARYVGYAMSSAPEGRGLPCHRVLNRLGEMAPGLIFGGEQTQRSLLESEGVVFTATGRVDLAVSRFEP